MTHEERLNWDVVTCISSYLLYLYVSIIKMMPLLTVSINQSV